MSATTAVSPTSKRPLTRLAELVYRRRGRVVVAWIVALAAVLAIGPRVGGDYNADYSTPGAESEEAADLLARGFGEGSAYTIDAVWRADRGANDPEVRARVAGFLADARGWAARCRPVSRRGVGSRSPRCS
jgi:RND superfamily putative drug exporter